MAGKRTALLLVLALLGSVGCQGICNRWYPCQQPVAAYPASGPATSCVPCVPCCPPGTSGYSSAAPAVPAPVGWNAAPVCPPCR